VVPTCIGNLCSLKVISDKCNGEEICQQVLQKKIKTNNKNSEFSMLHPGLNYEFTVSNFKITLITQDV
jgi:hypothetical protein